MKYTIKREIRQVQELLFKFGVFFYITLTSASCIYFFCPFHFYNWKKFAIYQYYPLIYRYYPLIKKLLFICIIHWLLSIDKRECKWNADCFLPGSWHHPGAGFNTLCTISSAQDPFVDCWRRGGEGLVGFIWGWSFCLVCLVFFWHGDAGNEPMDHFCINNTLCCYISSKYIGLTLILKWGR